MKQNDFLGSLNKSDGMTDEEYVRQQAGLLAKVSRAIGGLERIPDIIHAMTVVYVATEHIEKEDKMTEKQKEVLKAMKGMTYLEWTKLSHVINRNFDSEAGKTKNELKIASPEVIVAEYERLF